MYESVLKDKNGKYIGKAHINEQTKTLTFPSGARTAFSYLEYDKHADNWYGSEITKIYFDEFQFRSEYQFEILRSRNRSRAKVQKGIRCTLNPDENHFVYDWVKPFLNEDGYPIKELGGKTRYYLIVQGTLHTDWDKEALVKEFNKNPQTYTYIPALLEDNKHLMENDPEYMDNLDSLSEKKRLQLLKGCWHTAEDSGMYFQREWLHKATHVPIGSTGLRAYDLAASEPTTEMPYPDYTASIMLWKSRDGFYYITGNYVESFKDPETKVYGQFRKRSGERDTVMLSQAKADGRDIPIVLPQDSGAAGKDSFQSKVRFFTSEGFRVIKDASVSNQNKLTKLEPFVTAAEHGLVYIVESSFPNKETLENLLKQLELFNNQRSTSRRKDDLVDCCATAFNTIQTARIVPITTRNQNSTDTLSRGALEDYRKITGGR